MNAARSSPSPSSSPSATGHEHQGDNLVGSQPNNVAALAYSRQESPSQLRLPIKILFLIIESGLSISEQLAVSSTYKALWKLRTAFSFLAKCTKQKQPPLARICSTAIQIDWDLDHIHVRIKLERGKSALNPCSSISIEDGCRCLKDARGHEVASTIKLLLPISPHWSSCAYPRGPLLTLSFMSILSAHHSCPPIQPTPWVPLPSSSTLRLSCPHHLKVRLSLELGCVRSATFSSPHIMTIRAQYPHLSCISLLMSG